jgi:signal peptidase
MVENRKTHLRCVNLSGWIELVAFAIVVFVIYNIITATQILGTPLPLMSVVSDSMEPVLHRGDMLIITGGNYNVRDIVIYYNQQLDKVIVHRIIEETDDGFIIKGDNNAVPDSGIVSREHVLGEVRLAIPVLGYPRLWLYEIEKLIVDKENRGVGVVIG